MIVTRLLPLCLLLAACGPPNSPDVNPTTIDWQGHRGARGLLPENTIPAFLRALSYPEVTTLEMDVVISADDRVVVSHDPWMEPTICSGPDGERLADGEEARISLRGLTLAEIGTYDCGQLDHPRFPEQGKRPARKPSLLSVFAAVDKYCLEHDRPSPRYNIELKYLPEWEGKFVPSRDSFARLVLADLADWGKPELVTLQCFDPPTLGVLHELDPAITLSYLDETPGEVKQKMDALGFVPPVYSPWYEPLTDDHIRQCRELGMQVVPWTVNESATMVELVRRGRGRYHYGLSGPDRGGG